MITKPKTLNLDRLFAFNKSLVLFNKQEDITWRELMVLMAIVNNRCYTTFPVIDKYLRRFHHTLSPNDLWLLLGKLVDKGYLSCEGLKPKRFSITYMGVNRLNELNKRVAATRYDR